MAFKPLITYTIYTKYGQIDVKNTDAKLLIEEAQYIWDALAKLHGVEAMISARP